VQELANRPALIDGELGDMIRSASRLPSAPRYPRSHVSLSSGVEAWCKWPMIVYQTFQASGGCGLYSNKGPVKWSGVQARPRYIPLSPNFRLFWV
jgi:hypothetical protein